MRNLLTRITLGATLDLTGRPILERICSFEPAQG